MKRLGLLLISVLQTLLRTLPFPCRTGLLRIGDPGPDAPVLLTGNFRLTVDRVRRALEGIDAYLLVADSKGINVWCAAAGGHLTNSSIVSILKTSGIESLVDHRRLILPQLAASAIEPKVICKTTGWKVIWGPVYATSIPQFLSSNLKKTPEMRTVSFPWPQRLEIAVAWAFPLSLLSLLLLPLCKQAVLPLAAFLWTYCIAIFLSFPLYQRHLRTTRANVGFIFFDFGRHAIRLILWAVLVLALIACTLATTDFSWTLVLRWSIISLILLLALGLDIKGSTPSFKSALHPDRLLRIEIDPELCKGAAACQQVCPANVFDINTDNRLACLSRPASCVQCAACIIQCPFDALHFRTPDESVILAPTLRNTKLDLMGNRKPLAKPPETT